MHILAWRCELVRSLRKKILHFFDKQNHHCLHHVLSFLDRLNFMLYFRFCHVMFSLTKWAKNPFNSSISSACSWHGVQTCPWIPHQGHLQLKYVEHIFISQNISRVILKKKKLTGNASVWVFYLNCLLLYWVSECITALAGLIIYHQKQP